MKIETAVSFVYAFLILLELSECVLPWATYCNLDFCLSFIRSDDLGLSMKNTKGMSYPFYQKNLCGPFKSVIENGCADFCDTISKFSLAGEVMFMANLISIFLNGFLGLIFFCKSKRIFFGAIYPTALWIGVFLKLIGGIVYMEITHPYDIKNTWRPEDDFYFNIGAFLYVSEIFLQILVAYLAYNLPKAVLDKISLDTINDIS